MTCPKWCAEPDCSMPYGRHLTFAIGGEAKVTRSDPQTASTRQMEKAWKRDLPAYKRLRDNGVQPRGTEGAADIERRAECVEHVTTGMTHVAPKSFRRFEESFGHSATQPVE